jgi:hypothetical protein
LSSFVIQFISLLSEQDLAPAGTFPVVARGSTSLFSHLFFINQLQVYKNCNRRRKDKTEELENPNYLWKKTIAPDFVQKQLKKLDHKQSTKNYWVL